MSPKEKTPPESSVGDTTDDMLNDYDDWLDDLAGDTGE